MWFVPWSMIVFNTPDKHLKYLGCEKRLTSLTAVKLEVSFMAKTQETSTFNPFAITAAYMQHPLNDIQVLPPSALKHRKD